MKKKLYYVGKGVGNGLYKKYDNNNEKTRKLI
jgi:hypothetical protein